MGEIRGSLIFNGRRAVVRSIVKELVVWVRLYSYNYVVVVVLTFIVLLMEMALI